MRGVYQVYTQGQLLAGDCLEVMADLPADSVDALITDPPAGVSFMNKAFDSDRGGRAQWVAWLAERLAEAYRLLKPGAHGLIWALPRTSHWTACAIEDAGFEIRDCIYHIFGTGFPKSHNIGKAIDKLAGVEREILSIERVKDIRRNVAADQALGWENGQSKFGPGAPSIAMDYARTAPATEEAKIWHGWGSALKPAVECWWLIRKPLGEKSIAENVLKWGTGALNIDGCRIPTADTWQRDTKNDLRGGQYASGTPKRIYLPTQNNAAGRWPADLLLSHSIWCEQKGITRIRGNGSHHRHNQRSSEDAIFRSTQEYETTGYGDAENKETIEVWECHESCPIRAINEQGPGSKGHLYELKAGGGKFKGRTYNSGRVYLNQNAQTIGYSDEGGTARYFQQFEAEPFPFFYAGKASRAERNAGLEAMPEGETHRYGAGIGEGHHPEAPVAEQNTHPTVKSQTLMRYLTRLICPPGGTVLDCFAGSGSTLLACITEGHHFIGIEMEDEYLAICAARIWHMQNHQSP